MNISTNDIYYKNGDGDNRRFYAVWHSESGVICFSFYNEDKNDDLIFAEDFCLETAIKMRDELTKIIAKIPVSQATAVRSFSKKMPHPFNSHSQG